MAKKQTFKVLLWNIGYSTGLRGSILGYLFGWTRYVYTPRSVRAKVRSSIRSLLASEKPDLCCLLELRKKRGILPRAGQYAFRVSDNQYGRRSVLRSLPLFRTCADGLLSLRNVSFIKRFFRYGTKKLVYDVGIGHGLRLLLVHFSLNRRVRKKQCEELKEIIGKRGDTIVCGDFNIFQGTSEVRSLATACALKIAGPRREPTYPSLKPRKHFDLFLCPKRLMVSASAFPNIQTSDHLPVLLTLQFA